MDWEIAEPSILWQPLPLCYLTHGVTTDLPCQEYNITLVAVALRSLSRSEIRFNAESTVQTRPYQNELYLPTCPLATVPLWWVTHSVSDAAVTLLILPPQTEHVPDSVDPGIHAMHCKLLRGIIPSQFTSARIPPVQSTCRSCQIARPQRTFRIWCEFQFELNSHQIQTLSDESAELDVCLNLASGQSKGTYWSKGENIGQVLVLLVAHSIESSFSSLFRGPRVSADSVQLKEAVQSNKLLTASHVRLLHFCTISSWIKVRRLTTPALQHMPAARQMGDHHIICHHATTVQTTERLTEQKSSLQGDAEFWDLAFGLAEAYILRSSCQWVWIYRRTVGKACLSADAACEPGNNKLVRGVVTEPVRHVWWVHLCLASASVDAGHIVGTATLKDLACQAAPSAHVIWPQCEVIFVVGKCWPRADRSMFPRLRSKEECRLRYSWWDCRHEMHMSEPMSDSVPCHYPPLSKIPLSGHSYQWWTASNNTGCGCRHSLLLISRRHNLGFAGQESRRRLSIGESEAEERKQDDWVSWLVSHQCRALCWLRYLQENGHPECM